MSKLLTPAAHSPKLAHGLDKPIEAAVLYLAPFTLAGGPSVCPFASPGCAAACLNTAGRGGIGNLETNTIQRARIAKTRRFHADKVAFTADLAREIAALERKAARLGKHPAVRLNGTSDIPWERIPVTIAGITHRSLIHAFPAITFYDYTKVISRLRRPLPENYYLTFSLSETNDKHAREALEMGYNVAVVLDTKGNIPATWSDFPVVPGDKHDYRFLDPQGGHIVALTPKGKARKDLTGFTRSLESTLELERVPFYASMLAIAAD